MDSGGIGKSINNLLTSNNSPLPAKNMISNVLYKALTSNSVQNNSTSGGSGGDETLASRLPFDLGSMFDFNASKPITLTDTQQQVIGENLGMWRVVCHNHHQDPLQR